MILAATSSTVGTFPSSVDLDFSHITAYVKMSITNLDLAVGDEVASVLVSANANIAYRYYYYVGGAKVGTLEENGATNAITILTDSPSNIWFACAPMASGTELTISVTTTNSKVYTKVINTPAALAAGHVATFDVDFAGITPPSDKVYNLVTSYSELTAGSKVIIAAVGATAYAAGIGTTESNFISTVSQAKSLDYSKITNPAATVDVFTIEAGGATNTIALNGTNGYLYAKGGGNCLGIQTTNDVNGYWTPTIVNAETGEMTLIAMDSSNNNHIRYNGPSSRFSCYASGSSVSDLQALYKLEGSGSGPSLITPYTVTYNGNGNTGGTAPASVVTSGPFTVAAAGTLVKTDCTFTGWNTAANGSGSSYAAGASAVATGDLTLYAQWSSKTEVYALTPAQASNTAYANTYDVVIDGMTWNAPGNQNFDGYWRIGGRSLTNAERVIYAKSDMDGDCDEIVISTNGVSNANLTVSSITVVAYPTADDLTAGTNGVTFTTSDTFTFAVGTAKTLTFTKSGSTDCDGYRYKIVFTCSNSKNSNYGLDLKGITFYKN
ncbi:MAG: InlB B-repeat-containing protein [Bacteroidales bacterium]|nr:InlB B-repeat-containing protein [Bacteroidales bacterium]